MEKGSITLTMIKPVAVKEHHVGDILAHIEHAGFRIIGLKMTQIPQEKVRIFYEVHKNKPFFAELVDFMASGPVVAALLEKNGTDLQQNAVHGSDSDENAVKECWFFFSEMEQFR
jgi:nucleoside-diphosphate kinase